MAAEGIKPELGDVQQTLFIPLAARARETRRRHPALRDPKAVEILESVGYDEAVYGGRGAGLFTMLRTLVFDHWVREFLAGHPEGAVAELGTGLNTRFERTDNGSVRWLDLDLPDTIALRRRFFEDGERRRMIAGSLTDEDWMDAVAELGGPYFFVADGVLTYLEEDDVTRTLARIAERFPGSRIAFETYPRSTFAMQRKEAARKGMPALWRWACDDPGSLERLGLRLTESATATRPPAAVRRALPARYRYLLPLADAVMGRIAAISLFRAGSA